MIAIPFPRAFCCLAVLTASSIAHAAGNGANDYLLSVKPEAQAATLAKAVGEKCVGRTAFYMGIVKSGFGQGKGFWSIRCTDDRSFVVQVNPDGTSSVLECAVLKRMNAGTCFRTLAY
jgi:hypothetical protein